MNEPQPDKQFALCIENRDSEDLEKRKIYVVLPDEEAAKEGYLRVIDDYGADALRFALMQMITHGQDLRYSEDRVVGARNFCNKLWNVTRFVVMNLEDAPEEPIDLAAADLSPGDRWVLSRHHRMLALVDRELEAYNIGQAADALYEHIWSEFCDWYVELAKSDLYEPQSPTRKAVAQEVLRTVLSGFLRALHPIMPFITEELWHRLDEGAGPIAVADYPTANERWLDAQAEVRMGELQGTVTAIRTLRAALTLSPSQRAPVTIIADDADALALLEAERQGLRGLGMVSELELLEPGSELDVVMPNAPSALGRVYLHVPGSVDIDELLTKNANDMAALEKEIESGEAKLSNEQFISRAPQDVVQQARDRVADARRAWSLLKATRDMLLEMPPG